MKLGDVLEIVGAILLTVAAYHFGGWAAAVGTAGVAAVYFAQCYATLELPRRKRNRNLADARAQLEFALNAPGVFPDEIQRLKDLVAYWEAQPNGVLPVKLELPMLSRRKREREAQWDRG